MSQPSVNAFFQARKKTSKPNAKKALFIDTQPSKSKEKDSSGIKKLLEIENEKSAKPNLETLQPKKVGDSKECQSPLKLKAIPETGIKCQSPLKRDLQEALDFPAKAPTGAAESPSKQAKKDHCLTPSKLLSPKIPIRSPGHGISKSAVKPVHRLEGSAKKALFLDGKTAGRPGFPSLSKEGIGNVQLLMLLVILLTKYTTYYGLLRHGHLTMIILKLKLIFQKSKSVCPNEKKYLPVLSRLVLERRH